MINIKGLNKADVLKSLYNNSKSKLQGKLDERMAKLGLFGYLKDMTTEEAQSILDEMGEEKYFDYLNGRTMKVDLTSDIEFDGSLYDRDNGEGSAQMAIDKLKSL